VHVTDDREAGERVKERWDRAGMGIPLVVLQSPYRSLLGPLVTYIDALTRQRPDGTAVVTVLLPEFLPAHWWEHLLHMQTALRLKGSLLFRPGTVVTSVPYHLNGRAGHDAAPGPEVGSGNGLGGYSVYERSPHTVR
jgi:hypothetical protein